MNKPDPIKPPIYHRCFEALRRITITATFTLEYTASEAPSQVNTVPIARTFVMHVLSDTEHAAIMLAMQHAETVLRGDLQLEHAGEAVDIANLAMSASATDVPYAYFLLAEDCLDEIRLNTAARDQAPTQTHKKAAIN